jgi:hypothetical protein
MITIHANSNGGWGNYFAVKGTDAQLADWLRRRGTALVIDEEEIFEQDAPLCAAVINPECEHGLSARLCYGEGHYPTFGVNTMDPAWR